MNWKNTLKQSIRTEAPARGPVVTLEVVKTIEALGEAAKRFAARTDSFAEGKAATCRDIAEKLAKFGSFASDRQRDFALKLIE